MQHAAAADQEGVGRVRVSTRRATLRSSSRCRRSAQLAAGDVLALVAGKGAGVDQEGHAQGGLVDRDERQRLRMLAARRWCRRCRRPPARSRRTMSPAAASSTSCGPGSRRRSSSPRLAAPRRAVGRGQRPPPGARRSVPRPHAADADAAHVVVVVQGGDQHLQRAVRCDLGRRQASGWPRTAGTGPSQRSGVGSPAARVRARRRRPGSRPARRWRPGRTNRSKISSTTPSGRASGAVDLVDHDHRLVAQLQGLAQDEAGLGHGALDGVHQQQHAVGHLEHALDLAAEVGVAGRVDEVDLDALPSGWPCSWPGW